LQLRRRIDDAQPVAEAPRGQVRAPERIRGREVGTTLAYVAVHVIKTLQSPENHLT
jgi:hypothetical protein